eukprot:CAMPEP_0182852886 /NCGR_PEP_ID=MMETSP0034_2-20130328/400_1 /TAXON_ID=156128 /ORGANISM="Nephroselmis pyriformis, Strain CCMP717" /LENGTH=461 /DNA_ID=CAMNT_0024983625 /DNA_START=37 /DNA_END=1422 /DNA_ORIENTATION=-
MPAVISARALLPAPSAAARTATSSSRHQARLIGPAPILVAGRAGASRATAPAHVPRAEIARAAGPRPSGPGAAGRATALRAAAGVAKGVVATVDVQAAEAIVEVDLGDRSYPIYIGQGLLDAGDVLRSHVKGNQVLIVTNETIAPLYLKRVEEALGGEDLRIESVILQDGEEYKTMDELTKVFDKALSSRLDRKCTMIALGGGVIGDMTGFAASAYQRGVNFIQIPTTVMAMVDSSVGGKTAVNHPLGKNMIGAFYQPQCVLIDIDTLDTLPDRELASGLAEVVKYGLIRDAEFFEWMEENMDALIARDPAAMIYAVERSCVNKAEVVTMDEREGGIRATLNLGHTFGHAVETGVGYGEWLHGEAVSMGMVMAADMSYKLGWIEESIKSRTVELLKRAKLPVSPDPSMTADKFRELMAVDKKVENGKLKLILLEGALGGCVVTGDFDKSKLDETLDSFCNQ